MCMPQKNTRKRHESAQVDLNTTAPTAKTIQDTISSLKQDPLTDHRDVVGFHGTSIEAIEKLREHGVLLPGNQRGEQSEALIFLAPRRGRLPTRVKELDIEILTKREALVEKVVIRTKKQWS